MTLPAVGVVGYDRLGKRVADAIRFSPDLRLAGIYERDARRIEIVRALDLPLVENDLEAWANQCAVVVVCEQAMPELMVRTVYSPDVHASCPLFGLHDALAGSRCVRVPCADAVAFAKLLNCLPTVERLFSSCARRVDHVTENRSSAVDSLEPLFDLSCEDADLQALLSPQFSSIIIRRVRVPYTHSHLHHLKLDLHNPIEREAALAALRGAAGVRVVAGSAGFANTALVQEFDRDLGRPRGDRPEVFVWEASVAVVGRSLFLTVDVSPEAIVAQEMFDAVRCLLGLKTGSENLTLAKRNELGFTNVRGA